LNDYAETITAERVRRVGGEFNFYELGESIFDLREQIFDKDGFINENVPREKLFKYIYYTETKKIYIPTDEENLIGVDDGTAYYYFEDALSWTTLAQIKTRASDYVIFAENCYLSNSELAENNIVFKQIPDQIEQYR
jgi:adenine-specific DNA-methyltransferase